MGKEISTDELLRLVSTPIRNEGLDSLFNFEVSLVKGFMGESLIVNLNDYELMSGDFEIYRLRDEYPNDKYR